MGIWEEKELATKRGTGRGYYMISAVAAKSTFIRRR